MARIASQKQLLVLLRIPANESDPIELTQSCDTYQIPFIQHDRKTLNAEVIEFAEYF